jgi:chemotaxis protein histidine kinase CheA
MVVNSFAERLARVRQRFVSMLDSKINDAYAALANLANTGAPTAIASVERTYREIHGIVGIGPTVGFPATSRAARGVEDVLRVPYQDGRGLTPDEIQLFKKRLSALREAATRELDLFYAAMAVPQ